MPGLSSLERLPHCPQPVELCPLAPRGGVNGGDKTDHWDGGMVVHLPNDLGPHG